MSADPGSKAEALTGAAAPLDQLIEAILRAGQDAQDRVPDGVRGRVRLNQVRLKLAFAVVQSPGRDNSAPLVLVDAAGLRAVPEGALSQLEIEFDMAELRTADRRAAESASP